MEKQELEILVGQNLSSHQIAREMSISQTTVKYWLKKFSLKTNKKQFNQHVNWTENQLKDAVRDSICLSQVLQKLEMGHSSGNYRTINKYIKRYNIDNSHFRATEVMSPKFVRRFPLEEILIENSPYEWTNNLKKRLIEENVLTELCSECGINTWNNKRLVLQLDHINGHRNDNRIENLRLLCPNCHSQTETFSGRNKARLM